MELLDWLLLRIPADTESGWPLYLAAVLVVLWQWRWCLGFFRISPLARRLLLWPVAVATLLPTAPPFGESVLVMPALTTFAVALLNGDSAVAAWAGRRLLLAVLGAACLVLCLSALCNRRQRRRVS